MLTHDKTIHNMGGKCFGAEIRFIFWRMIKLYIIWVENVFGAEIRFIFWRMIKLYIICVENVLGFCGEKSVLYSGA